MGFKNSPMFIMCLTLILMCVTYVQLNGAQGLHPQRSYTRGAMYYQKSQILNV